jgi:DNA-binding SARP family transcriptional activator
MVALETCKRQGYRFREAMVSWYLAGACDSDNPDEARRHLDHATRLCQENGWKLPPDGMEAIPARSNAPETPAGPGRVDATATTGSTEPTVGGLIARCFGPFEVETPAGLVPVRQWQGTRTRLVLAYLLHHPDGVTRERLSELVYGDEEVSRAAILMILSRLRQALEPDLEKQAPSRYILYQNGRYIFNSAIPVDLDVREVNFQLDQAQQASGDDARVRLHLEKALGRYRGRFLADLTDSFWVQTTQENWHQRILVAHDLLFSLLERAGDDDAALNWADALVSVDRCAESAYRVKMRILAARGQRPSAVRLFRQLEEVLANDLGVEPAPESKVLAATLGA